MNRINEIARETAKRIYSGSLPPGMDAIDAIQIDVLGAIAAASKVHEQKLDRVIQILTSSEDNEALNLTAEEIDLRGRVADAMCRALFDLDNPDEVNARLEELERLHDNPPGDRFAFLEEIFWPETLEPMKGYARYEDDSPTGSIGVVFGNDGDGHITVWSKPDPDELKLAMRFRMPMTGGGQSPRVRNALLALAEAIRRDNEDRPQMREA